MPSDGEQRQYSYSRKLGLRAFQYLEGDQQSRKETVLCVAVAVKVK